MRVTQNTGKNTYYDNNCVNYSVITLSYNNISPGKLNK